eukprot:GHVR01111423.1.p1 GENE.GHVR01111423.1~~GHVR01111423.1.p1  ORF type:complete len:121 (+),score=24.54 GHVR01111423.1:178-540(+)
MSVIASTNVFSIRKTSSSTSELRHINSVASVSLGVISVLKRASMSLSDNRGGTSGNAHTDSALTPGKVGHTTNPTHDTHYTQNTHTHTHVQMQQHNDTQHEIVTCTHTHTDGGCGVNTHT